MRPIDADALIDDIKRNSESYFADDFALIWVNKQPTIDIVRCKECKWHNEREGCFFSTAEVDADDFCSYGERSER